MSTPSLFANLIDDAAVFPPGNFSLADALARRDARAGTPDAPYVGPLLLPPALVADALEHPTPSQIEVVGRPGTSVEDLLTAAKLLRAHPHHQLRAVHLGVSDDWRALLGIGVEVVVEIAATDLLAGFAELDGSAVTVKIRTGATPTIAIPTPGQLAQFILGCAERSRPFRATGGLHHAVTRDTADGREFGFLNLLTATAAAHTAARDLPALLDDADPAAVSSRTRAIIDPAAVRSLLRSYGCCDVDEPLRDLRDLALIPTETTEEPA